MKVDDFVPLVPGLVEPLVELSLERSRAVSPEAGGGAKDSILPRTAATFLLWLKGGARAGPGNPS